MGTSDPDDRRARVRAATEPTVEVPASRVRAATDPTVEVPPNRVRAATDPTVEVRPDLANTLSDDTANNARSGHDVANAQTLMPTSPATVASATPSARARTGPLPPADASAATMAAPPPAARSANVAMADTIGGLDDASAPTMAGDSIAQEASRRSSRLRRGAVIGRYVVVDELGAGGMGVVYVAFDPKLNRKVALKLVKSQSDHVLAGPTRIEREAQALARLSHPNVVTIYDVGAFDDQIFLAMEMVEGQTLSTWQSAQRTWREVLTTYLEAARGLAAAHAAGVIHRDFKPGNVIVGDDGRVRVLDFGLARGIDQEDPEPREAASPVIAARTPADDATTRNDALSAELTQVGSVMGTPLYMPPEQFRGEVVTEAADQFSFCVALYEALYGMLPFRSQFGQPLPPVAPAPEDTRVPTWLRRILLVGLAARAEDRFPSMAALIAALEDDPAIRRRKWLMAGGGVVAAAAIAIGAFQLRGSTAAVHDPCAETAPFAGIWDGAARTRLQAALATTGIPDAEGTFARTAAALDATTDKWVAARRQACTATRKDRTQSEVVLLARLDCLDRQRTDLRSLVALLSRADEAIAKQATAAVYQLQGPALCEDPRSQLYVAPPPVELADRVAQIRTRLSDAQALVFAGKDADADAQLQGIVDDARALGYQPLLAEALYIRGRRRLADFKSALRALDEAELIAVAHRVDTIAARAAATRLHKGAVAGHGEEMLDSWSQRAQAWVERDRDLEAVFALEQGLGTRATTRGDHATAERHSRRALDVGTRAFGAAHPRVFGITVDLAFDLIQLGRHLEAIAMLEPAIATFDKAYGDRTLRVRYALDVYGYALNVVGRASDARKALERGLSITTERDAPRALLLCDLSRVDLAEDKLNDAVMHAEQGIALLRELGVGQLNLAGNLDALASAYAAVGRYADALAESRGCLEEYAKANNQGADTAPCLAVQGFVLVELGQAMQAVEVLERALQRLAGHPTAPGVVANVQFQLARAIVASSGDRARARELASQARTTLVGLPHKRALLERLETWWKQSAL